MQKTNPSFLNGVPELLMLKLLSEREMYGYEIVKAIQTETKERLAFGEGCIYPYLHYLEEEGLVKSQRKEVGGRSRNYYQITRSGRSRLSALAADWNRVTEGITFLLGGKYA